MELTTSTNKIMLATILTTGLALAKRLGTEVLY